MAFLGNIVTENLEYVKIQGKKLVADLRKITVQGSILVPLLHSGTYVAVVLTKPAVKTSDQNRFIYFTV